MGMNAAMSAFIGSVVGWGILGPYAMSQGWVKSVKGGDDSASSWLIWLALSVMLAEASVSLTLTVYKVIETQYGFINGSELDNNYNNPNINNDADQNTYSMNNGYDSMEITPIATNSEYENEPDLTNDTNEKEYHVHASQEIPTYWWVGGLICSMLACVAIDSPLFHMPLWEPFLALLIGIVVSIVAIRALGDTDMNPVSTIGKLLLWFIIIVAIFIVYGCG